MYIIGITGQTGVGKTLLANEFKCDDTIVIDVDKVIRKVCHDDIVIQQTVNYLYKRYREKLEISQSFWETLMYARNGVQQLEDPLYEEAERQIDLIINSANTKNVVLDYSLLPKTKYFNICGYRILLLPASDELRKQAVIKRDNLESTERLERRDKYGVDYRNYRFNRIVTNFYEGDQFPFLKDSILKELEEMIDTEKNNPKGSRK